MSETSKGLSGMRIGNFKAFAETQQIPIRRLTLIYGANSAGKSSIIHSLLLANHALENGNVDVHQTKIGGASLDLGGFSQYVHKHELKRRFEWGIEFEHKTVAPVVRYPSGLVITDIRYQIGFPDTDDQKAAESVYRYLGGFTRTAIRFQIGLPDTDDQKQSGSNGPRVLAFELDLDGSRLMRLERQPDGRLRSVSLNFEHPNLKAALDKLLDEAARPADFFSIDRGNEERMVRMKPHIDPARPNYEEFGQLLLAAQRAGACPARIEIHRACYEGHGAQRRVLNAGEWRGRFENLHLALSNAGLNGEVFIWDDFHDRFLVSDIIGILMGNGFDVSNNPSDKTTWARISGGDRVKIQREFVHPNSPVHELRDHFTIGESHS